MKKSIIITAALLLIAGATALDAQARKPKAPKKKAGITKVVYTGDLAKKVVGYNGPTPLNITIKDNRIAKIEVLENKETPAYLKRATAVVFQQYIGKTIKEAYKLEPDVATGATYTSEALIKNIQKGLESLMKP